MATQPFHITELSDSHAEDARRLLGVSADDITAAAPGERWGAFGPSGTLVACCSIWWDGTPIYNGAPVGLVGHYAARDAGAGSAVLEHACSRLTAHGRALAVGPMDGSTWRRYRLVTDRGDEPPFFLEPDNPDEYPLHFAAAGFEPLAGYTSAVIEPLDREDPRVNEVARRLAAAGVTIRNFAPARFDDELRRVYQVSRASFADNFLYTPVSEEEFLAQYAPLRRVLRPELVFLAEDAGVPVGFAFVTPDFNQAARGRAVDTMILKTLARVPGSRYAGLGGVLTGHTYAAAHKLGFRRAIHALMHESNASQNLSRDRARTIRRYTLYARPLGGGGAPG